MNAQDNRIAHQLISEYGDRDDMGRLRTAIAKALTTARKKARAAAFKDIRARIETASPKLSFGSANGSVMKKCILAELYELEATGEQTNGTVENEAAG